MMETTRPGGPLEELRPYGAVSQSTYENLAQRTNRRLLGFTLGDVPRELIHAAGFQPVAVIGRSGRAGESAESLPAFCCSLMRSTLDLGISQATKPLAGLVLAHICDTTRDFSGIWRQRVGLDFFHDWLPPKQLSRPSARTYLVGELERFRGALEAFSGRKVPDGEVARSIDLYETQRALLCRIKEEALARPGALSGVELYTVFKASLFMDPVAFNRCAQEWLDALPVAPPPVPRPLVPLMASGKLPEPLDLIGVFEEAGGVFVDDDFLVGSRLLRQRCPPGGSPLERLADRYLTAEPFPGYLYERPARQEFVARLARDAGAAGIVFWDLKFCEPYNFDHPDLNRHFEAIGTPTFHVETDLQMSGIEQLRTRVQAFLEQFTLER